MSEKILKIVIAGGGTGGHLFPGIAVAEEFLKRGEAEVLFVCSGNKLERDVLGGLGFPLRTIRSEGLKGKGPVRTLTALLKIPGSIWAARRIIRDFRPRLVLGVGGYASGPVVLVARLLGVGTAVMEQNALPGLTNRILGKLVDRVFLTYRGTRKWFSRANAVVTGNPVRAALLAGPRAAKSPGNRFTILIFGGSQGARAINRALLAALPHLRDNNISFIHQTGKDDHKYVSDVYRSYGFDAEVQPFIQDMAAAYNAADLVICRAGATSIAEITVMGKAAILVPFPFAVDNHQKKNAEALAGAGAALLIEQKELDGKELAETIESLLHHRERLREMEAKSAALGNSRAAADIVDNCLALLISRKEGTGSHTCLLQGRT